MKLRIGTRKSVLARVQTDIVSRAIVDKFPDVEVEIVAMSTEGDRRQDRALDSFGGKGVFTRELELGLLNGEIDLAVHSAKDMPMELPEGLALGAVLDRGDPRDVLVTTTGIPMRKLPAGSIIGTSSLRRELQIKRWNPQVKMKLLRGNVQTRLEKLKNGEYDAILLAAAGLERLGLTRPEGLCLEYLDTEEFIPAPGQAILGVEIRKGELGEIMSAIQSETAAVMLRAEREYMTVLGGSCNAPCAAYCREEDGGLVMNAMFARDGVHPVFRKERIEFGKQDPGDRDFEKQDIESQNIGGLAARLRAAEELADKLAMEVSVKTVSLVGAGPGDAGLLTRKGLECVRRADVIIYDNLISGSILNEARLDAELIYVGKRSGAHYLSQDGINRLLVEKALEGGYVVRLKGGDPFVFGRGGEEALELEKNKIPFEIVPGVSSSYSVPAYAGIPVTHRGLASSFHVITGHESSGKDREVLDYETLAKEEGTLVFLMGLKNLGRIAGRLIECGKAGNTPAAVIQNGTTAGQKKAVSDLEHIAGEAERCGIGTPAVIVVGDVVGFENRVNWFGRGPLGGKRVLVTGTRYFAAEMEAQLRPQGAETVAVSVIESRPRITEEYDRILERIEDYRWLVFTSGNGVRLFFEALRGRSIDLRRLMHLKFAAIGRRTAEALRGHGFLCDFVPESFSGADLAREWIPQLGRNDKVLLMRAEDGSPVLSERLEEAGIDFTDFPLYETWVDERRREELNRIVCEVDYVTIASASAARALCRLLEPEIRSDMRAKVISIGPSTTEAARALGLEVSASAAEYTAAGITEAILADVRREQEK